MPRRATSLAEHGIRVEDVALDLAQMMARKQETVDELARGTAFLLTRAKIAGDRGRARDRGARARRGRAGRRQRRARSRRRGS